MSFADFSLHLLYSSEDTFPSSCGDARTTGATSSSIHLLHSLFKGHVAAVCPQLSMMHLKGKACPGKASRLWAFATCRTLPEASTIFQKDYQVQCGFSEYERLQEILYPFLSRQKQKQPPAKELTKSGSQLGFASDMGCVCWIPIREAAVLMVPVLFPSCHVLLSPSRTQSWPTLHVKCQRLYQKACPV